MDDELVAGYLRFRSDVWPAQRARYEALANGQKPATMVLACSDSRVDPQTIFAAGPGELFVMRNVAALAPPYAPDAPGANGVGAALEFAVKVLQVSRLVVMGHSQCGGVKALGEGAPPQAREFIASWVEIAKPALADGGDVPAVVRLSLANLATYPWIADAVAAGRLSLIGYMFDIHAGVLNRVTAEGVAPVA